MKKQISFALAGRYVREGLELFDILKAVNAEVAQ